MVAFPCKQKTIKIFFFFDPSIFCHVFHVRYDISRRCIGSYPGVDDELVHAPGAEGGPHGVHDGLAGVDVGDDLLLPSGALRPILEQQDLWLHDSVWLTLEMNTFNVIVWLLQNIG